MLGAASFNWLSRIRGSLGLTQAALVLLSSLLVGLALSAMQLRYHLVLERTTATDLLSDVLTSADGGATNAAWTLDPRLAEDVVANVMAIRGIWLAEIRDEHGAVLARAAKPDEPRGELITWLTRTFIGDEFRDQRTLSVVDQGKTTVVGMLRLELAPSYVADNFLPPAAATVAMTFVGAFLLGVVLLWISVRLVTRPLERAATVISAIDPESTARTMVPVPAFHRRNEFGKLLVHTNDMLDRLRESRDALKELATRDTLTGLSNRSLIRERLDVALARAARERALVAVLFLDLDRFKNINDSLGHDIGDELLRAVARNLIQTVRSHDSVGRLGGDEFLVVLEGADKVEEVVLAVKRIAQALDSRYVLGSHEVRASASIGIAIFPHDGEDAITLMRHADLAMYKAKGEDGPPWRFYTTDLSERVEARLRIENELLGALSADQFTLSYQPKLNASGGGLSGCEALLRWNRDGLCLPAAEFVEILEEIGIIHAVGDWVLEQVCRQIRAWGALAVPVAVNVSARQLGDPGFVDRFLDCVDRHGVDAGLLEVEITETALMADLDRSRHSLGRLRRRGVAVSIDDFGTGYSSLSYLSRLPISALKIDRSFVSGRRRSPILLSAIIAMAKALGIQTVAEGVETEAQRKELVAQGCDQIQGHLVAEPLGAREFEEFLVAPRLRALRARSPRR